MISFWKNYEEFENTIYPKYINWNIRRYNSIKWYNSRYDLLTNLNNEYERFKKSLNKIEEFDFSEDSIILYNTERNHYTLEGALRYIVDLCYSGEMIFLLNKRLAVSHWAQEFLYYKDVYDEWKEINYDYKVYEDLKALIEASKNVIKGFEQIKDEDTKFLIWDSELPINLLKDFATARDLFMLGFEEEGILICSRGLEYILRLIADKKGLKFCVKDKAFNASDADLYDLIEIMYNAKWSSDKSRLINLKQKNLLHLLRSLRNSSAHSYDNDEEENFREYAQLIFKTSNGLWKKAEVKRARLIDKKIVKSW